LRQITEQVNSEFKQMQEEGQDLSVEQLAEIEKESLKRVKRDRAQMLDCGMRLVYEKATFNF
jgi:hypothetical protein